MTMPTSISKLSADMLAIFGSWRHGPALPAPQLPTLRKTLPTEQLPKLENNPPPEATVKVTPPTPFMANLARKMAFDRQHGGRVQHWLESQRLQLPQAMSPTLPAPIAIPKMVTRGRR